MNTHKSIIRASNKSELLTELKSLRYGPAPKWLGRFGYLKFTGTRTAAGVWYDDLELPTQVRAEAEHLQRAIPPSERVTWNTVFVQKYEPGEGVTAHRDPRNNVGHTAIGLYGDFEATYLHVWGPVDGFPAPARGVKLTTLTQRPGDVWVLPCTLAGNQGPQHAMSWPTSGDGSDGARYAIILNTIQR